MRFHKIHTNFISVWLGWQLLTKFIRNANLENYTLTGKTGKPRNLYNQALSFRCMLLTFLFFFCYQITIYFLFHKSLDVISSASLASWWVITCYLLLINFLTFEKLWLDISIMSFEKRNSFPLNYSCNFQGIYFQRLRKISGKIFIKKFTQR